MGMLLRRAMLGSVLPLYATWLSAPKGPSTVLSNGNLTVSNTGSSYNNVVSTINKSAGKWQWEITVTGSGSSRQVIGVANGNWNLTTSLYCGSDGNARGYYGENGNKVTAGVFSAFGAAWGNGDVMTVGLNMDAGTLMFKKNGTLQGTAFSGLTGSIYAAMGDYPNPDVTTTNFGATSLLYPFAGYNPGLYV